MHRLVYFSNVSIELNVFGIEAMVEEAAERNRRLQISGALHYNGLNFLQILEGPQEALTPLYLRIRKDARHSGVVKLADERILTRSYPDLGMTLWCGAPKRLGTPREATPREKDLPAMIDAFFGFGHAPTLAEQR
ncbi:MAG: BLUF domain-containing protein [Methylocystis sp.]